jgi:hypothetical protein
MPLRSVCDRHNQTTSVCARLIQANAQFRIVNTTPVINGGAHLRGLELLTAETSMHALRHCWGVGHMPLSDNTLHLHRPDEGVVLHAGLRLQMRTVCA